MSEQKKIILLAEDDAFVRDIYYTKFEAEGFEIILAENGLQTIKKIQEKIPDLVLLDIIMPYMGGIDVLKELKNNEKWKKIPVILLTNLSDKEKVEETLSLGAKDYIIKSHFTPSEVVSKVKSVLGIVK